jgi:hypothetical protein
MLSRTPIPSKLKRPDELSDPVCKVVISFLAGKLKYAIDNIAVMRENLFRETLFSWEHLSVTSLLSLPRPKKDTVDALFFIEQVTRILRYQGINSIDKRTSFSYFSKSPLSLERSYGSNQLLSFFNPIKFSYITYCIPLSCDV